MAKHYVTFGQVHTHSVNGQTLDKDCVARFDADDARHGHEKAFEFFGPVFCFDYHGDQFDPEIMKYFPRGFVDL